MATGGEGVPPSRCLFGGENTMKVILDKVLGSLDAIEALAKLDGLGSDKKIIPGWSQFAYRLARALKRIRAERDTWMDTVRDIASKVGTKNDAGNYEISPDKQAGFDKQLREALKTEIDLPGIEQITLPNDIPGIRPCDLAALEWLVTFPE